MRTWGESDVVKIKTSTSPKLKDKGVTCLFAGYTEDHDGDCYRMWDPIGHYMYVTRDTVWLKRMYFTQNNVTAYSVVPVIAARESVGPNDKDATKNNNNKVANSNEKENQDKKLKVKFGGEELVPADYEEANSTDNKSNEEQFLPISTRSGHAVQPKKIYQHEYQGILLKSEKK